MNKYTIKAVSNGKVSTLHKVANKEAAFEYAVAYSNENNVSCLIYGRRLDKALYFTHKITDNNYMVMR